MSEKIGNKEFVLADTNLQEIFTDGLCAVHTTDNIIRMDFMSFQPQMSNSEGRRVCSVKHRVIMTLDNFVDAFNTQQGLINQMIESGLVQWNAPEKTGSVPAQTTDISTGKKPSKPKVNDK